MELKDASAVIGKKRYRTATATILAHNDNDVEGREGFRRPARVTFLCRTPKGNHFAVHQPENGGERPVFEALDEDQAIGLFERLPVQMAPFEVSFPGVVIEDA